MAVAARKRHAAAAGGDKAAFAKACRELDSADAAAAAARARADASARAAAAGPPEPAMPWSPWELDPGDRPGAQDPFVSHRDLATESDAKAGLDERLLRSIQHVSAPRSRYAPVSGTTPGFDAPPLSGTTRRDPGATVYYRRRW